MVAPTTALSPLRTRRAVALCVYAVALAVLGCTAGALELVGWSESGQPAVVAAEQAADATDGPTEPPNADGDVIVDGAVDADRSAHVALTDYDARLARIRAGDCHALGACVGTRGSCLVIMERHIDVASESYYDPATKGLLAEYLYDPMNGVETWTTGYADCAAEQFVQNEFIICER